MGVEFRISLRARGNMRDARIARDFAGYFAPDRSLILAEQVHGNRIELLAGDAKAIVPECDGFLVPHSIRLAAGIRSADCLAICLCDSGSRDAALVHSGWRGSRAGIAERALAMLMDRGALVRNIHAAFSPSIQACCYAVGSEFRDYFPEEYIHTRGEQLFFDNQGYARAACLRFGLLPEHIYSSPYCTACNSELFYSYRREGQEAGRILSITYSL
jgi:YfiH family protein